MEEKKSTHIAGSVRMTDDINQPTQEELRKTCGGVGRTITGIKNHTIYHKICPHCTRKRLRVFHGRRFIGNKTC